MPYDICRYEFCVEARVGMETDTDCIDVTIVASSPPKLTMLNSVTDVNPLDTLVVEATACYPGGYLLTEWVAVERDGKLEQSHSNYSIFQQQFPLQLENPE